MNNKKVLLLLSAVGVFIVFLIWILFFNKQKNPLQAPLTNLSNSKVQEQPSKTFIEYTDPSGFSFNYPDNLSLVNNDILIADTYASIQLVSKGVSGSLNLKITDSKFKTLNEWADKNKEAAIESPKEIKLGTIKAMQIKTNDRLLVGALDQGVLFTIEIPRIEEDFWLKVLGIILAEFNFASPAESTASGAGTAPDEISFEGEEVVE